MATKSFDVRSLNKYLSATAADDLNRFVEKLPSNAGKTALIAGGIAWAAVAAIGLFAMLQTQKISELRTELEASETLRPLVPEITMQPVSADDLNSFTEKAKILYPGLSLSVNGNVISVTSRDTSSYAQFREMMGHVVSGGEGWKVSINSLCIGRECKQNAMDAALRVEKFSIDKPVSSGASAAD